MKYYELTYLISPDLKEKEVRELKSKIESLLQSGGGILIRDENPLKINLGYEVNKKKEAILAVLRFQLDPKSLEKIETKIRKIPQILRYVILVQKELPKKLPKKIVKKIPREKKVELEEIEKKLEEILGE